MSEDQVQEIATLLTNREAELIAHIRSMNRYLSSLADRLQPLILDILRAHPDREYWDQFSSTSTPILSATMGKPDNNGFYITEEVIYEQVKVHYQLDVTQNDVHEALFVLKNNRQVGFIVGVVTGFAWCHYEDQLSFCF